MTRILDEAHNTHILQVKPHCIESGISTSLHISSKHMPCAALPPADADRLQHAVIEQTQLQKLRDILDELDEIDLPPLQKQGPGELSITLGAQLEVDERPCSAADISTTFFAPCDWPFDVLDDERWDTVYFLERRRTSISRSTHTAGA